MCKYLSLHHYCSVTCLLLLSCFNASCQNERGHIEVYGFIMTDIGYNFNSIDPDWFDVMRPTKLPSREGQFGPKGNVYFSLRQTRFGARSAFPTKLGELKTQLDFDLFGFGVNTGQTTFHLINAYGEIGKFLMGQTASVFMDQAVFPVTLDYWGPMSRVFIFNVQLRYTPIREEKQRLAFAIERPGATADGGDDVTSIQLDNVKPYYRLPNFVAHYRRNGSWGHAQVAAVAKLMNWHDRNASSAQDLSGTAFGWGWTASTAVNAGKHIQFKFQVVQGEGMESHIADAPADVVPTYDPANTMTPVKGIAQPVFGFFGFTEIRWNKSLHTTAGYSMERVGNGDLQAPGAFRRGQYALLNLRYEPWKNLQMGLEYQYGRRDNRSDGFSSHASKVQASFKFNFSERIPL